MEFISAKTVMNRIMRHPLMTDVPYETLIDYAVDFIQTVGTPSSFEDKTAVIQIEDYRGQLPCDLYNITQVRDNYGKCLRYSTDSFHLSPNHTMPYELTYKTQNSVIFTSFPEGELEIAYKAIPVDGEGVPKIPSERSYVKALELYVKLQWFTILFDEGKISPQVLQNTQRDYTWAVGQASTDLIMPTIDQMESISNMWNRLLLIEPHRTGYTTLGRKEHLRTH